MPSLKVMDISLGLTLLPSSRILTISLTVISSDKLYTPAFKLVLLLSLVYTLNIVTFLIRLLSFNVFAILSILPALIVISFRVLSSDTLEVLTI